MLIDEKVGRREAEAGPKILAGTQGALQQRDDTGRIAEHRAAHDGSTGRRPGNHTTALLQLADCCEQRRLHSARCERVHDAGLVTAGEEHPVGRAHLVDESGVTHGPLQVDAWQFRRDPQVLRHGAVRNQCRNRTLRGCIRIA